jgi:hypothetical protein
MLNDPCLAGDTSGERTWVGRFGGDGAPSRHCTLSAGGMCAMPNGDDARRKLWTELCR